MPDELEKLPARKSTSDFLSEVLTNLAEGLTGLAASDKKQWALSLGYIFQRTRGGQFLKTLIREWDKYKSAGKIKDEYQFSEQAQACLQEMLDFLDNDAPDSIRFDALKKVFMVAATETISKQDSVLPQQYMRLCRSLSSGEILVLSAAYELPKDSSLNSEDTIASVWLKAVAARSGLEHSSLVEAHEEELIRKHLLTPRKSTSPHRILLSDKHHLTDLGYALCKFIDDYEPPPDETSESNRT